MGDDGPLVGEALPAVARRLREGLEAEGRRDLAVQVDALRIVDRCRCGDDFCATFYTVETPHKPPDRKQETIPLLTDRGDIIVDAGDGRIVLVEILFDDAVRQALHAVCP